MTWDGIDRENDFPTPDTYSIEARKADRERIALEIETFLQSGGEIERLDYLSQTAEHLREKLRGGETWLQKNERHRRVNATGKFSRLTTFDS